MGLEVSGRQGEELPQKHGQHCLHFLIFVIHASSEDICHCYLGKKKKKKKY